MDGVHKKSLKELLPKEDFEQLANRAEAPRRRRTVGDMEASIPPADDLPPVRLSRPRPKRKAPLIYLALAAIVVVVGGYYLSAIFASATVKITPTQQTAAVTGQFKAIKAPAEGIEYSVIKLEESVSKEVPANGQVKRETKAVGTVTITNNFSTAGQALVVGTRLSDPAGRIFKLDANVTVPGMKAGVAGKITVKVTAAAPGAEYNIDVVDLKIVGFKGTAKYDKFGARPTTAFHGGASGMVSSISDQDREQAITAAKTELKSKLESKAKLQIPNGYASFPDTEMFTFSDSVTSNGTSTATITIKAVMVAILFNSTNLAENLAAKYFSSEPTEGVKIANLSALDLKLIDKEKFDMDKTDSINFSLSGEGTFVWPVDPAELKSRLKGGKLKDRDAVFAAFPNIYRAQAHITPPWLMSFPEEADKINIIFSSN